MRRFLLLLVLLLQSCSYENPYIARIRSNYFPIDKTGSFWIYRNENGSEKYIEVKENPNNLTKDGKEVIILEENYNEAYWYKDNGYISRYREIQVDFNGQLTAVESRWQNYIEIPLVKGNSWNDSWNDTLVLLNEPLYRTDNLNATVQTFETLNTEAGEFKNCYKIKFTVLEEIRSEIIGDSLFQETYYEWYAPGVGLVKSAKSNEIWELIDYGNIEKGD